MQIILGTTPHAIGDADRTRLLIQNLGPGIVYFNTEEEVTTTNGFQIAVNGAYEFPTPSALDTVSIVASAPDTDVRVLRIG